MVFYLDGFYYSVKVKNHFPFLLNVFALAEKMRCLNELSGLNLNTIHLNIIIFGNVFINLKGTKVVNIIDGV